MRTDAGQLPRHPALASLLDGLANAYRAVAAAPSPSGLAAFLFATQGFKGAEGDYYDPAHSDLVQVIERRRGIPISLACVFILVGNRLGLPIFGCDVPEHFLTRASEGGRDIIIDCFDGGKILAEENLAQLERKYAPAFARLLRVPAGPEAIVARVLRNLINAYHLAGDRQASQFMFSLAEDLRGGRRDAGALADISAETQDQAGRQRPFGDDAEREEEDGADGPGPDPE